MSPATAAHVGSTAHHMPLHSFDGMELLAIEERNIANVHLLLQVLQQAGEVAHVVHVGDMEAVVLRHVGEVVFKRSGNVGGEEIVAWTEGRRVGNALINELLVRQLSCAGVERGLALRIRSLRRVLVVSRGA